MITRARLWPILLAAAAIAVAALLWDHGASFYLTTGWDRPDHPDFASLRASGSWGHGLGLVGVGVILINLSFLARRHVRALRRFGALRTWLQSHVITGLLGPLLIVYHSTFDPRSTVAIVAACSLAVLVVTGVIGRFIYALVPHTVAGAEAGREELERRVAEARERLAQAFAVDDPLWVELERLGAPPPLVSRSKAAALLWLPVLLVGLWRTRVRVRGVVRSTRGRSDDDAALALALTDLVVIRKRLHTLVVSRQLLRWWRGLHRVFAVVMVLTAAVHIGVVLYFGYSGGLS